MRRKSMFSENIVRLRKINQMTQEDIAEAVGVSRQAVAKWESGETIPDLEKCKLLAELFGVSLDDLANYEPEENMCIFVAVNVKNGGISCWIISKDCIRERRT